MPTQFFLGQIEEQRESWKEDHAAAMQCRDLEAMLRKGITFFYMIRTADEAWSEKVQDGKAEYEPEKVREIRTAYDWWLKPCERIGAMIDSMEEHFEVEGAEHFRSCWRLARNITSIDVEELIASSLEAQRGEVVELTEEDWGGLPSSTDSTGARQHTSPPQC